MNKTTNELTYSEIRSKCVVDAGNGKNLGHVCDMVFTSDLKGVVGVIAPFGKRGMFGKSQDVFIPIGCIDSIGEDVIIVDINGADQLDRQTTASDDCGCTVTPQEDNCVDRNPDRPNCDRRCEKCMLFDCEYRWKK